MNYFELYEQLKKTGKLLSIGSIWEDQYGTVAITAVEEYDVYYTCLTFNSEADLFEDNRWISKGRFLKIFTRIK